MITERIAKSRGRAEQISARLPGLLVQAERIARTLEQGVHGRKRSGMGETFWQFRPYQPGEDVKRIDWRQSARSNDIFVREQEWEAAQSVWIGCDISGSMSFSSDKALPSKVERAVLLTLALAMALLNGGEKIALIGTGMRPMSGKGAIERLIEGLLTLASTEAAQKSFSSSGNAQLPAAATVLLISDFLEPLDEIRVRLDELSGKAVSGVALQLIDPAEHDFPYRGRVLFQGLEGEGDMLIRHAGSVQARYRELYAAHRDSVQSLITHRGWLMHHNVTSEAPEMAIMAVYQALAPKMVA